MAPHDRRHDRNPGDAPRGPGLQHDRKHDLNAEPPPDEAPDHAGGRHPSLSAKSLAGRGDALDASDDLAPEEDAEDGDDA